MTPSRSYAQQTKGSTLLDAKNRMIDFGENRAQERIGECSTADIGTKAGNATLLRRPFETSKTKCGDRRVPATLRAVSWRRRLELGEKNLETANLRVAHLVWILQPGSKCDLLVMRRQKFQTVVRGMRSEVSVIGSALAWCEPMTRRVLQTFSQWILNVHTLQHSAQYIQLWLVICERTSVTRGRLVQFRLRQENIFSYSCVNRTFQNYYSNKHNYVCNVQCGVWCGVAWRGGGGVFLSCELDLLPPFASLLCVTVLSPVSSFLEDDMLLSQSLWMVMLSSSYLRWCFSPPAGLLMNSKHIAQHHVRKNEGRKQHHPKEGEKAVSQQKNRNAGPPKAVPPTRR